MELQLTEVGIPNDRSGEAGEPRAMLWALVRLLAILWASITADDETQRVVLWKRAATNIFESSMFLSIGHGMLTPA